jgi:hypothetical protein
VTRLQVCKKIVLSCLLAWATPGLWAQSILPLPEAVAMAASALPQDPRSAYHAWDEAEAEAARIAEAWTQEPASLAWTRVQLARIIKHKTMPTRAARGLALVHVAMHDAYALAVREQLSPTGRRLALSMAAADVLGYLYPAEERAFERIVFALAARIEGATVETLADATRLAMAHGRSVSELVIARAEGDGAQRGWNGSRLQYYAQNRYYGPGSWEPTPPYFYYPPDEPFAPGWKTWALQSGSEFRPTPPAFASPVYLEALDEVIRINAEIAAIAPLAGAMGATDKLVQGSAADRLRIAKFWVDGHGSVTPPGHWNQIAIDEAVRAGLEEQATLRLFAQLDMALADAFIACWDAKYHWWTVRPVTVAKSLRNITMKPAVLTPPFPSYPSGHATFSGAAAEIISQAIPDRRAALEAMAEEAAASRLYGGIHFAFDNDDGLKLGRKVANAVIERFGNAAQH